MQLGNAVEVVIVGQDAGTAPPGELDSLASTLSNSGSPRRSWTATRGSFWRSIGFRNRGGRGLGGLIAMVGDRLQLVDDETGADKRALQEARRTTSVILPSMIALVSR